MFRKLRYITAGESHGQALVCILEGMPSQLAFSTQDIDRDLRRRQGGYGRGGRMKIERDHVQILSGVRQGRTMGSPIALLIENRDWANWQDVMSPEPLTPDTRRSRVTRPRPGHADLPGGLKYEHADLRNVLERSSARETAARVAAGAVAKKFLGEFGIEIVSYVTEIGGAGLTGHNMSRGTADSKSCLSLFRKAEQSIVRCPDRKAETRMIQAIDRAMKQGDSLGGIFEIAAIGVPCGLGSFSQWDRRLGAKLTGSLMGIQAIKGVEIGMGFDVAKRRGSEVMDEIFYKSQKSEVRSQKQRKLLDLAGGFYRKTNHAGGIEGGVSNGMPIIIRAVMKPIPTLRNPLSSVDIVTKKRFRAAYERSDVCAVPAASIIGEAVIALAIADSFLEKFGGDSMAEITRNYEGYLKQMQEY